MSLAAQSSLPDRRLAKTHAGLRRWFWAHQGTVLIAALLAFAGPITFFTGALSVMRTPIAANIARLGLWWGLYGLLLWCLLLAVGQGCERLAPLLGRYGRGAVCLAAACAVALITNTVTAGRASILIEQGLVYSTRTMHLHGFVFSFFMALLYFAHLRRTGEHERASSRLVAAQAAQRHARRRIVDAQARDFQGRIDPKLLFDLLDAVRGLYEHDAARAERMLDELILFLRAALPRLRLRSSSLAREVELAHRLVKLRALSRSSKVDMRVDVEPDAMHARFPPGVLLPLLGGGEASPGLCALRATRTTNRCLVVMALDRAPSDESVAGVRLLLAESYAMAGTLEIQRTNAAVEVIIEVPYELD